MIYELSNPHDAYTFEASTVRVAALVCLLLGAGAYGANSGTGDETNDWCVHIFSDEADIDAEFKERWGASLGESIRLDKAEVREALLSLMLIGRSERKGYEAALAACPTRESRDAFTAAYEDSKRSSMTNLMLKARQLAEAMEEDAAPEEVVS